MKTYLIVQYERDFVAVVDEDWHYDGYGEARWECRVFDTHDGTVQPPGHMTATIPVPVLGLAAAVGRSVGYGRVLSTMTVTVPGRVWEYERFGVPVLLPGVDYTEACCPICGTTGTCDNAAECMDALAPCDELIEYVHDRRER